MSGCCSLPPIDIPGDYCPECNHKGKLVDKVTMKSFVLPSLREIRRIPYLFCRTRDCSIVYFSGDGEQTFTIDQVQVRVYQKEPQTDNVFVCYCFRHTVGEIRTASPQDRATIVEDINAGIKARQCACDLRNPQGSCCLGNVREAIKQTELLTVTAV